MLTWRPPDPDALDSASIELDAAGAITAWDRAAEGLFGWRASDAIGQPSAMLVPERNRDRYAAYLAELLRGPKHTAVERTITVLRRDGREFAATVAVTTGAAEDGASRIAALVRAVRPLADARW